MNYSIIWTNEALITFEDRVAYLKNHWTEKEIKNFKIIVKKYLQLLTETIGKKPGRLKDVHMGLIVKQVSIIYRLKNLTKEIELILLSITGRTQKISGNIKHRKSAKT